MPDYLETMGRKIAMKLAVEGDKIGLEKYGRNAKRSEQERATVSRLIREIDELEAERKMCAQRGGDRVAVPVPPNGGPAHGGQGQRRDNAGAADPKTLGNPFHNPYTFVPFATVAPPMREPTLLTADESELDRFTGIIKIRVRTLSPLLSCAPASADAPKQKPTRAALQAGNRFILPASGVRGALRNLMTVITGGRLGAESEGVWLCQGRDLQLGPASQNNRNAPPAVFLARVTKVGSEDRPGEVELNGLRETGVLLTLAELRLPDSQRPNPRNGKRDTRGSVPVAGTRWIAKLSGRPVNGDGKREGVFMPSNTMLELPGRLWAEYQARHRSADYPDLREGDLIWLEHKERTSKLLSKPEEVASIQWARWGRKGCRAVDAIGTAGEWLAGDTKGKVDLATDLFGFIDEESSGLPNRAGRVRADNLVFDAETKTTTVELAVLAQPHPGCLAFYRDVEDLDTVGMNTGLRGYKVYRTTKERGEVAPWHYKQQGEYYGNGKLKPFAQSNMAHSCHLIEEGSTATVMLSVRSLSKEELSYLLALCTVDWRLGGGKPLGLGHCRPLSATLIDECGKDMMKEISTASEAHTKAPDRPNPSESLNEHLKLVAKHHLERLSIYQATQRPVDRLRYPRLTDAGRKGGLAWFQRMASPKKSGDQGQAPAGLHVFAVTGNLQAAAGNNDSIQAQALPKFNPSDPFADVLYGYDIELSTVGRGLGARRDLAAPHAQAPPRPNQGPQGQNRETRRANRDLRNR